MVSLRRRRVRNEEASRRLAQVERLTETLEERVRRLEADSLVWKRSAARLLKLEEQ